MRRFARFKHLPIRTRLGPPTILHFLREDNRRELPLGPFDRGVCSTIMSDHDSRPVSFDPVEANG